MSLSQASELPPTSGGGGGMSSKHPPATPPAPPHHSMQRTSSGIPHLPPPATNLRRRAQLRDRRLQCRRSVPDAFSGPAFSRCRNRRLFHRHQLRHFCIRNRNSSYPPIHSPDPPPCASSAPHAARPNSPDIVAPAANPTASKRRRIRTRLRFLPHQRAQFPCTSNPFICSSFLSPSTCRSHSACTKQRANRTSHRHDDLVAATISGDSTASMRYLQALARQRCSNAAR